MGRPVSARALDAVFRRLDAQRHAEVRKTNCEAAVISLRYVKPRQMQVVVWLNTGLVGHPRVGHDPRETQIGTQLGYIEHRWSAPWMGIRATAHGMLLPDAWRGMTASQQLAPTFYVVQPPDMPVRDLTVRSFVDGGQRIYVERWRGLLSLCRPPNVSCPASNPDPRFFARYTAVLRVDTDSGLPASLSTVAQGRGRDRGRFVWARTQPVAQTEFRGSPAHDEPIASAGSHRPCR